MFFERSDDPQESCLFNALSKIIALICTSYTFQRYVSVLNFETDLVETPQYKVGRMVYMFWSQKRPSFAIISSSLLHFFVGHLLAHHHMTSHSGLILKNNRSTFSLNLELPTIFEAIIFVCVWVAQFLQGAPCHTLRSFGHVKMRKNMMKSAINGSLQWRIHRAILHLLFPGQTGIQKC